MKKLFAIAAVAALFVACAGKTTKVDENCNADSLKKCEVSCVDSITCDSISADSIAACADSIAALQ